MRVRTLLTGFLFLGCLAREPAESEESVVAAEHEALQGSGGLPPWVTSCCVQPWNGTSASLTLAADEDAQPILDSTCAQLEAECLGELPGCGTASCACVECVEMSTSASCSSTQLYQCEGPGYCCEYEAQEGDPETWTGHLCGDPTQECPQNWWGGCELPDPPVQRFIVQADCHRTCRRNTPPACLVGTADH
jgi:hypothetical protein